MLETLQFLLAPDRGAARRLRRALAERGALIGVAVGGWADLLERAQQAYLVGSPGSDWDASFSNALGEVETAFWSKSLEAAPDETAAAVEASFLHVLRGVAPGTRLADAATGAMAGLQGRAARHITDLARLHDALGETLPPEMAGARALLAVPTAEASSHIAVCRIEDHPRLDAWQLAVLEKLRADLEAGGEAPDPALQTALEASFQNTPRASESSALGHLQRRIFGDLEGSVPLDESVQFLGLRDPLEEAEVAAGMVQQALDREPQLNPSDFALLLPNDAFTRAAVASSFDAAGLPLAGIEIEPPRRDLAYEAVYAFLLCQRTSAPAMAQATLLSSPLQPWDAATGMALADQVMQGHRPRLDADAPEASTKALRIVLSRPADSPNHLTGRLRAFTELLQGGDELNSTLSDVRRLCEELAAILDSENEIPWDRIERAATPRRLKSEFKPPHTQEGITVLDESLEPWRDARYLIVIGCAAGHYPADAPVSPVFTDSDLGDLAGAGFQLATGADILADRRARFRRQLSVASEEVTFLIPRRDTAGEKLALSSCLAFIAQHIDQIDEDEALVIDVDGTDGLDKARGLAIADSATPEPPREIHSSDLELGRNLLLIGSTDGEHPPNSPSRLDTLLVSPLAWLLDRAHLQPREWAPEDFGPLIQGTLAHAVFEGLFVPDSSLPSEDAIRKQIPALLGEAIEANAAFAAGNTWGIERFRLEQDLEEAALAWRRMLDGLGARILACEVTLKGTLPQVETNANGGRPLPLRGTADVVLQHPDGSLSVVDYKKSSSGGRRTRMESAFDLQASLYRAMLETGGPEGAEHPSLREAAKRAPRIDVLYYTLNDQTALSDGPSRQGTGLAQFETFGNDVSKGALDRLKEQVAKVARGRVCLNHEEDDKTFQKNWGIKIYALEDNPLLRIFLHRRGAAQEESP
ncbi:MAG: PD-(D/E)XK nuclease family protein [bacterium]|nr:PD-(D/E)XK nuclease family protein [bacterium]